MFYRQYLMDLRGFLLDPVRERIDGASWSSVLEVVVREMKRDRCQ
jgi:hypothetical protein